jgi:transcriptional regulator with XRE-family HTH domain
MVFKKAGSNRNQFCKKFGYNYQTLQAYWNTDKLPPGNVLENLAKEYNVSLDLLVLGRRPQDVTVQNPVINRITRFLEQQDGDSLLQVEGALKMFNYMTSLDSSSFQDIDDSGRLLLGPNYNENDIDRVPMKLENLTDLLTKLAKNIQKGNMSKKDKEFSKELLNQIVLNIYERKVEVKDEWARLEEID